MRRQCLHTADNDDGYADIVERSASAEFNTDATYRTDSSAESKS
jgi:hypothetical protein